MAKARRKKKQTRAASTPGFAGNISAKKRDPRSARERVAGEGMVTLMRRCRYMGWGNSPDSLQRVKNPLLGSFLGQLAFTGKISDSAYQGLTHYAGVVERHRQAIGLPPPTAQAQSLQASGGGSVALVVDDEAIATKARRAAAAYMGAIGALQVAQSDLGVVNMLIRDEAHGDTFADVLAWFGERRIAAAEHAGKALAVHFGLCEKTS